VPQQQAAELTAPETPAADAPEHDFASLTQEQAEALWKEEADRRAGRPAATPADTPAQGDPGAEPTPAAQAAAENPPPAAPADKKAAAKPADEDPVAKKIATLEQELKRATGRISALQREQAALAAAAAKSVRSTGGEAPTNSQQQHALKSPEKWEALKRDFPEWGEAISDFMSANMQAPDQSSLDERVQQQVRALESRRVSRAYPDWHTIVASPQFAEWRELQDDAVQALGSSDLADDAIEMIRLFKESVAAPASPAPATTPDKAARLAAAAAPTRTSRPAPTPRADAPLSAEAIWKQEAERRRAMRAQAA
jgi:hypothetical protein